MNERSVYPNWRKYLEKSQITGTELYELKFVNYSKTKSFAFNRVEQHQIDGLMASLDGLYQRIMDQPYVSGGFQQKKLCDSMWIKASGAFIVIVFWNPRHWKVAYKIPVEFFVKLKEDWKKKSITMEELDDLRIAEVIFL